MKKSTVIRNDSPHAVKLDEGAKVAARRLKKSANAAEPEQAPESPKKTKSAPIIHPKKTPPPTGMPLKTRARAKPKKAPVASLDALEPVMPPAEKPAVVVPPVVLDEGDLWEKESPIHHRLADLRTRNALLSEQLQRLKPPFQVRGKIS